MFVFLLSFFHYNYRNQWEKVRFLQRTASDDSNDENLIMIQITLLLLLIQLVLLIFLVSVSENLDIDHEAYELNDNEDIQEICNKLLEKSFILKNKI